VTACRTCQNPQVEAINALLAARTPIRAVSRQFGLARSSVARHSQHVPPADRRLVLAPDPAPETRNVDPMEAALELLAEARTERQRLKALEGVRASTALLLRQMGRDTDPDLLRRIDRNLTEASEAFRDSGNFEAATRALQGVREAVRHKLDAVRSAETFPWTYVVVSSVLNPDGTSRETGRSGPITAEISASAYWKGVPARFRDPSRYTAWRGITLGLNGPGTEDLKVYEGDVVVWAREH